jgi:hypothetical protein
MSVLINHKKLNGGIVSTAGRNVTVWYSRESSEKFNINGSFNGLEAPYDWVLIKDTDTKWIKSGVVTFNSERKSTVVEFKSPFVNTDYYIFFLSNNNVNMYWDNKKTNQFTINGSFSLGSEVSWLAIHKKIGQQTGIRTPKTIYVGERILNLSSVMWNGSAFVAGDDPLNPETLPMPADSTNAVAIPPPPGTYDSSCNLQGWYKNELIIRPTANLDTIGQNTMGFSKNTDYSVIISKNTNINTFWIDKRSDRVKVGTSYPIQCIIHYLFIKTGLNWWDEI